MRPRSEVALALSLLGVVVVMAGLLGRRPAADTDERPSTFSVAPGGSRGLLDAVKRLGIPVQRFRERSRELPGIGASPRQVLVILAPSVDFSAPERSAVLAFAEDADLVLAGRDAQSLMRCFGYRVNGSWWIRAGPTTWTGCLAWSRRWPEWTRCCSGARVARWRSGCAGPIVPATWCWLPTKSCFGTARSGGPRRVLSRLASSPVATIGWCSRSIITATAPPDRSRRSPSTGAAARLGGV